MNLYNAKMFFIDNFSIIGTGGLLIMGFGIWLALVGELMPAIASFIIGYFFWSI